MRNINGHIKEIYKAILNNRISIIGDKNVKEVWKAGRDVSKSFYKATILYLIRVVGAEIMDKK